MVPITYSQYRAHGGPETSQNQFDSAARQTAAYMHTVTMGRAPDPIDSERVMRCAVEMVKLYVDYADADPTVTSETVGPHSVHYVSPVERKALLAEDLRQLKYLYLTPWLYGGIPVVR